MENHQVFLLPQDGNCARHASTADPRGPWLRGVKTAADFQAEEMTWFQSLILKVNKTPREAAFLSAIAQEQRARNPNLQLLFPEGNNSHSMQKVQILNLTTPFRMSENS